ncbi:MAG: tetratricopeptide repeat protein [Treponema sp.]|nr:tetratricopeptide repeat protein [Treponema sp.]
MPSIEDLRQFKASFQNIGGEKADLLARKLPLNDLELPDAEAQSRDRPGERPAPGRDRQDRPAERHAEPEEPATGDPIRPKKDRSRAEKAGGEGDFDEMHPPSGLLARLQEELEAIPPDPEDFGLGDIDDSDFAREFPLVPEGEETQPAPDFENLADREFAEEFPLSDTPDLGTDPFADLSEAAEPSLGDDPFADFEGAELGSTDETQSPDLRDDPFADFAQTDDAQTPDLGDDPFADLAGTEPTSTDETQSPDLSDDPFADFAGTELGSTDETQAPDIRDDPFADFAQTDDAQTPDLDDDPFADFEGAELGSTDETQVPGLDDFDPFARTDDDVRQVDLGDDPFADFAPADETASTDDAQSPDLGELGDFTDFSRPAETDDAESPALDDDPFAKTDDDVRPVDLGDDPFASTDDTASTDEAQSADLDGSDPFARTDDDIRPVDLNIDPFADFASGGDGESDDLGDDPFADFPATTEAGGEESTGLEDAFARTDEDGEQLPSFEGFEFPEEEAGGEGGPVGLDDFRFPEELEKTAAKPQPQAGEKAKAGFLGRGKAEDNKPPAPVRFENIKITPEEFRRLQRTLADYPLNLRIACQEIIAEKIGKPEKVNALVRNLVDGAPARATAILAGDLLDRTIFIAKGFQKSSGEALEAEQSTFKYALKKSFLPAFRVILFIVLLMASVGFLGYRFVYIPLLADSIYRDGYGRIAESDYEGANGRFAEALRHRPVRNWFYRYAEAFRERRQFALAEEKYEQLLRFFPRDHKGVLDFADLQTNYLHNYERADSLLRRQILDFSPDDFDALLAVGDNSLAWSEIEPDRLDDARIAYARVLERHGWTPPVVERMLRFFIRDDNLGEVINLQEWFDADPKRGMRATTLAELGGYLLDKQSEQTRGIPNPFLGRIRGITDILIEAIRLDPSLPEPHYQLARFYNGLGRPEEERVALEHAVRTFDAAPEEAETARRLRMRIDAHRRYADVLIDSGEFLQAEAQLVRGISLYEGGINRWMLTPSPNYGRLFANLGDLEYFVKSGDMEAALNFYRRAEQQGWAPPEMRFRMGVAYYQMEDWGNAIEQMFVASRDLPLNRRVLFALGNAAMMRGDYASAQGFYGRLLEVLESHRSRLPVLLPNDGAEYLELAERMMMAQNNAGVASERLAAQTGDLSHRTRAMAYYAEAQRAWDARSRDPTTMIRSGSVPLPYLNMRGALYPEPGFEPQIFVRIDRDALETSRWERLAPGSTW